MENQHIADHLVILLRLIHKHITIYVGNNYYQSIDSVKNGEQGAAGEDGCVIVTVFY